MHASYSGDLLQAKVQCQHSDTITDDRLLVGENDILCQSLPAGTLSPKPPSSCSISLIKSIARRVCPRGQLAAN